MEGHMKRDILHDVSASLSDPNAARYDFIQPHGSMYRLHYSV